MPDQDRFERKLGAAWRKIYRLGRSSAPPEAVADEILRAVASDFQKEGCQGLFEIYCELREAVSCFNNPLFSRAISKEAFNRLSAKTEEIIVGEGYPDTLRFGQRAALRTFSELENSERLFSGDVLQQCFMTNLVSDLSERRCFGVVREGIMQALGRSDETQQEWEKIMKRALSEPCASFGKQVLNGSEVQTIRPPKRRYRPKELTLGMLEEPLPVLEK